MSCESFVLLPKDERPPRVLGEGRRNGRHNPGPLARQRPPNHGGAEVPRRRSFAWNLHGMAVAARLFCADRPAGHRRDSGAEPSSKPRTARYRYQDSAPGGRPEAFTARTLSRGELRPGNGPNGRGDLPVLGIGSLDQTAEHPYHTRMEL